MHNGKKGSFTILAKTTAKESESTHTHHQLLLIIQSTQVERIIYDRYRNDRRKDR